MNYQSDDSSYFFDFPVKDANPIAYSAFRALYYGTIYGSFGQISTGHQIGSELEIEQTDAIRISLHHLSEESLTDEYEYSLVFFSKQFSQAIWEAKQRDISPALKKLTRRVRLGSEPSLTAKRYRTPFWVKFRKPVYLAQYDPSTIVNPPVPKRYLKAFNQHFDGFLMRNPVGYPLVRNIFGALGLDCTDRREVSHQQETSLKILCYSHPLTQSNGLDSASHSATCLA